MLNIFYHSVENRITLQENLFLATEKVVAKNLISLLKMFFATNSIVAGTAVAKGFSNDYGGCKRYLFFATRSIVAKKNVVAIPSNVFSNKKARCQISCIFSYNYFRC